MTTKDAESTFRRAVIQLTATSFLVPAAGVITAPILARALSTEGRGELAAAMAPAALTLGAATLGLPDALTLLLARRIDLTRRALWSASVITLGLGLVCVLTVIWFLPFLQAGSPDLGKLIVLATSMTVPALVIGVFRGAALGRQLWQAVALERLANSVMRVGAFTFLWTIDHLSVMTAVLVSVITPIISGVVYFPLLRRPEHEDDDTSEVGAKNATLTVQADMRSLVVFGSKVWFGSVASMLLSRSAQLLIAPLSDVRDLGLYAVAAMISDIPLIAALAIQSALYGSSARTSDATQVATTSRMTLLAALIGCTSLGASVPFWIGPLFGEQFVGATVPTLMMIASAMLCIPGLMAATGLTAWGRPELRSVGLGLTLVVNISSLIVLAPLFGVIGACTASIASNVVMTSFMVLMCRRVMNLRCRDFVALRASDFDRVWAELGRLMRRPRRQGS